MNYAAELRSLVTLEQAGRLPATDTLVLTVNNRLARRLTLDLAGHLRRERQVSELPRVLPLAAWLVEAAAELAFVPETDLPAYRLDSFAAQMVWVAAIEAEEEGRELLDVSQAAALAMDADTLMDEWALQVPSGADTDEYRGFARWRARYRERLNAIDAEDANQGYLRVLTALQDQCIKAPRHLILAGFTDVSPRFAALLDAFEQGGSELLWLQDEHVEATSPSRYCAHDRSSEWRAAAAWAAQRLEADPSGSYAIVSVQLQAEAPFARRVVGQALSRGHYAFNVAVGRPLTEWPLVRAALAWMRVLADMAHAGEADAAVMGSAVLAGHCVGDQRDHATFATIDARWRRKGVIRVTEAEWIKALSRELVHTNDAVKGPTLSTSWPAAVALWKQAGARTTSDRWMPVMRAALVALGFPGDKTLDSVGYQVMGAFGDVLARFAALAPAAGPLSGRAAVNLLERAAAKTLFQPQRDPSARLDVLGLLEAEGGHWDGVWILGLTDDVLPATPQPNPLLPLFVLRQAGAPRATPERERQWAESMFEALCCCAPELVVSHSHREGERELRPSPLIAELPLLDWVIPERPAVKGLAQHVVQDDRGPALGAIGLASLPTDHVPGTTGGLDVLDTQARNPLWAFVRHRLGGKALDHYADLASQNVRGQFLHRALEIVWAMFTTQEDLHAAMADGRLLALIDHAIAEAADAELKNYPVGLRELECERAQRVLVSWFDVEARRTPFQVEQIEQTRHWTRGPLSLTVRLDRLDRLPDGRAVIVDYKTGMSPGNPESDWARVRPVNLQLPFYASVLSGEDPESGVAALVLAQVHARQVAVSGLTDADLGIEGIKAVADSKAFEGRIWSDILQRWRTAVEGLADEYASGYAANVVYRPDDLKYCDAMPFLRLHLEVEGDAE